MKEETKKYIEERYEIITEPITQGFVLNKYNPLIKISDKQYMAFKIKDKWHYQCSDGGYTAELGHNLAIAVNKVLRVREKKLKRILK
jgi:hypothetical protein